MKQLVRSVLPVTAFALVCGSQLAYAGDPLGLKSAVKETTEAVKQDAKGTAADAVPVPAGQTGTTQGGAKGMVKGTKDAAGQEAQGAVKGAQDSTQQGAHDTMRNAVDGVTNPKK